MKEITFVAVIKKEIKIQYNPLYRSQETAIDSALYDLYLEERLMDNGQMISADLGEILRVEDLEEERENEEREA